MPPALFRLTGAGHAVPVEGELRDGSAVKLARSVAECCPTGAVKVEPDHDEEPAPAPHPLQG